MSACRASVVVALLLVPVALPGQSYRMRVEMRGQTAGFQGVRLDSIPAADTLTGPGGGPVSPDGFAVECVGASSYCLFFRPGSAIRTTPITALADVSAWGFGVAGLSVHGTLRASGDLASANAWPGTDPGLQLLTGYVEYATARVTARGGRQVRASRLGTAGFDGVGVTVRELARGLELEGWGGWGLELATALPVTSPALNPLNDFQPRRRQLVAGASAAWTGAPGSATIEYEREVDPGTKHFVAERLALQAVGRVVAGITLTAGADYDVAAGAWGSAEGAVEYARGGVRAAAGVRRYKPHFELWTIWGAFSPVAYHAVQGNVALRAGSRAWLRGRVERYAFEASDAAAPLVAAEDDGWRWDAGVSVRPGVAWTLDVGAQADHGPGAASRGLSGSVTWSPPERGYDITLHAATLARPLEFRYSDAELFVVGLEADLEPSERMRVSLGLARYGETRERPDAAAFDFTQVRASVRIALLFGHADDLGRLPPAVRTMPGGRAARGGGDQ
jgi:hypothetical protein